MRSDLPKVLHPIGGRPMLCAVVDACREAGAGRIILVVGYKQELVHEAVAAQGAEWAQGIEYAVQDQQLGTGHAVRCAEHLFPADARNGAVFVLAGDGPLIRGSTLRDLLSRHTVSHAAATLATSIIPDPSGYGRIIRDAAGVFTEIVEHKQCTPEQLAVREVNPSYYCFDTALLFETLARVTRNPASGEFYITDAPALMLAEGRRVEVVPSVPPEDVLSINTPEQLAEVDAIYRGRRSSHAAPRAGSTGGAR